MTKVFDKIYHRENFKKNIALENGAEFIKKMRREFCNKVEKYLQPEDWKDLMNELTISGG